ncbi:NlpE N-terminal domain-containing protein [Chitinophaga jiangningensis]|uniref:NlpE N-terminal domain-containing protein n=1 Tax=Chitinophaga jiangningensis TaxID=1419482 RepID=A0A1M7E3Y6_9BACT|nr:copper resistance protein NlpE N-terminal domain-containing protein [Chitinophaga jiangningensis]SHL86417.1 NlpE N-terminal domain-containing protein [Chitinophaga jiangningensis]
MRGLLFLPTLALAFAACNNNNAAREQQDSIRINKAAPGQTTKLAGTYQGTLPCADCPGIDYQISLYDDSTYSELTAYQGRGENIATVETGTWRAINDSIAMLVKKNDSVSFVASEHKLILLDKAGKRIEGMLASNYILKPVEGGDRRTLLADKKTQGVTFYANGNEPFWSLELDKKNIRFKTVGGDSIYTPLPGLSINTDTLKVYKGKGITINIRPTTCADDMSGYLRPNTVQLEVGDKTYSGCGEFIK